MIPDIKNNNDKKIQDIAIFVMVVLLTRWLFRAEYLVHMDSVNFALGIIDYNPEVHQPHPPGYFLYVMLGKLFDFVTGDPVTALFIISLVASAVAVAAIYLLAFEWFGRTAAVFSALLFVTSPFAWFYGTVALTYIVEFCLVSLIALLCWHVSVGRRQLLLPAAILMGVAVGFRQTTILFLAPLCLYVMRSVGVKHVLISVLVFTVTVLTWFLPMLIASGGAEEYFTAIADYWNRLATAKNVLALTESEGWLRAGLQIITNYMVIITFYSICFAAGAPLILMRGLPLGASTGQKRFVLIWIIPVILFFTYFFISFINMGYMSVIFPALFVIIGAKIAKWYEQLTRGWQSKTAFVVFLGIVNTCVFLYIPSYMGYLNVKKYEEDIEITRRLINKSIDPENTLIIAMDAFRYGFREIGYYSPEYYVVQHPEMNFSDGIKVFAMHNRKTVLLSDLPLEKYSNFVMFTMPRDITIQEEAWRLFPEGRISRGEVDGITFLKGPSSELKYLFPNMARLSDRTIEH